MLALFSRLPGRTSLAACASMVCLVLAVGAFATPSVACTSDGRPLIFGYYAFFKPVSYSADPAPNSAGSHVHLGYESNLLSALEAMKGAGLSFSRRGIASWKNIWLRAAGSQFDMVGGGITILDSRTLDAAGRRPSSLRRGTSRSASCFWCVPQTPGASAGMRTWGAASASLTEAA